MNITCYLACLQLDATNLEFRRVLYTNIHARVLYQPMDNRHRSAYRRIATQAANIGAHSVRVKALYFLRELKLQSRRDEWDESLLSRADLDEIGLLRKRDECLARFLNFVPVCGQRRVDRKRSKVLDAMDRYTDGLCARLMSTNVEPSLYADAYQSFMDLWDMLQAISAQCDFSHRPDFTNEIIAPTQFQRWLRFMDDKAAREVDRILGHQENEHKIDEFFIDEHEREYARDASPDPFGPQQPSAVSSPS